MSAITRIEEPGFEENGLRYMLCHSPSNRAACKKCSENFHMGEIRIGASQDTALYGAFFWRHIECFTVQQLRNLKGTYYKNVSEEENISDYSQVPGYSSLTLCEQEHVMAVLAALPETERQQKKEQAEAKAAMKAQKQAEVIRDWRSLLSQGDLEKQTADVLKAILKHLEQPITGAKKDLLQRLREYEDDLATAAAAAAAAVKVEIEETKAPLLAGCGVNGNGNGNKKNAAIANEDEEGEQENVPVQPTKKAKIK